MLLQKNVVCLLARIIPFFQAFLTFIVVIAHTVLRATTHRWPIVTKKVNLLTNGLISMFAVCTTLLKSLRGTFVTTYDSSYCN